MHRFLLFIILLLTGCSRHPPSCQTATGESVRWHSKANVFILFNLSCPLCQKFSGNLEAYFEPAATYSTWLVLTHSDTAGLKIFLQYSHIEPDRVIIDGSLELSKFLKADVTPQTVVTGLGYAPVYSGLISDRYVELGSFRRKANRDYLSEVLLLLKDGNQPKFSKTKAVGCDIE